MHRRLLPSSASTASTAMYLGEKEVSKKAKRRYFLSICAASCILACTVAVMVALLVDLASIHSRLVLTRYPSDPVERAIALLSDYPLIDGLVIVASP